MPAAHAQGTRAQIDAIWRIESARVIATVARMVRDVGLAEDLAQDAVVVALERWPSTGVPPNPGAWLTATAKHRAIDLMRRSTTLQDKYAQIARDLGVASEAPDLDAELDDDIGDDLLSLVFTCCHPVLSMEARVALTLRMLGGLKTPEIARAFLVPEATVGQRISRAKRTLADAGVPFEVPAGDELQPRLASVLEVVYLIFNEGYAATAGDDWMRPALIEEALRLGRILAGLAPDEPEVHGLVALMEIQASRQAARTGPGGEPILLADQDRLPLGPAADPPRAGGARAGRVAAAARSARTTSRPRSPPATRGQRRRRRPTGCGSPRCTRRSRASPARRSSSSTGRSPSGWRSARRSACRSVDALAAEGALDGYHLLPSVRGDLLAKLGRWAEARAEFERAASMTQNGRERELLLARAAECAASAR